MNHYPKTQYHHYIPQFMLRRFAIAPIVKPNDVDHKGKKKRIKKRTGNGLVNAVDLNEDPPRITTMPAKRTFGQQDMYKDDSKFTPKEQMRMEQKLGDIEKDASRIIARVVDAHTVGKVGIWLSRSDKDLLRKFLFVMKYRGPIFFRRFNHQTAEAYNSNDRDQFLQYMQQNSFKRPLDVWFDNLIKIIDEPMDPVGNWITNLARIIYPGDAMWLFINIRSMYMAFVTPDDLGEEFILTENAFSIHEGPVSLSVNRFTGEETMTAYTEFHLINVVSPRLVLILRHSSLSEPLEDTDPELKRQRKAMLDMQAQMHIDPYHSTSLLGDLPLSKARNSYTTVKDGRLILAEGADGIPRPIDKFHFVFFQLETRHVQMINAVMLDQAYNISTLIFKTESGLLKALEFYLSVPNQTKGSHSIKTISDQPDDPRLLLFRKLEHIAQSLGSKVKAKYHVYGLWDDYHGEEEISFDDTVASVLRTAEPISFDSPMALPTTVLVQVLHKTKLNVKAAHAIDVVLDGDRHQSFPDLVFEAVALADPVNFNQHTKALVNVDLRIWKAAWIALVYQAMREPHADQNLGTAHMKEMLKRLRAQPASHNFSLPVREVPTQDPCP